MRREDQLLFLCRFPWGEREKTVCKQVPAWKQCFCYSNLRPDTGTGGALVISMYSLWENLQNAPQDISVSFKDKIMILVSKYR